MRALFAAALVLLGCGEVAPEQAFESAWIKFRQAYPDRAGLPRVQH